MAIERGSAAAVLLLLAGCSRPNPTFDANDQTTGGQDSGDTKVTTAPPPDATGDPPGGSTDDPLPPDTTGDPPMTTGMHTTGDISTTGTEPETDTGDPPGQDCCNSWPAPGCNDPVVQNCVCATDPFCCDTAWDQVCAHAAGQSCDAGCPNDGSCCGTSLAPGCGDPVVADCVCNNAGLSECCMVDWGADCAITAAETCGACPLRGDCCAPHETPSCNDLDAVICVCTVDAFCCNVAWDQLCVDRASMECGAPCPFPG